MPHDEPVGFDHTVTIAAPATKVIAAFFDPVALATWWDVVRSVTSPRPLGAYALEWARSEVVDELLGPLGGVLHGRVIDFKAGRTFFLADVYWLPPETPPVGPMALEVTCASRRRLTAVVDSVVARLQQSPSPAEEPPGAASLGSPAVTSLHIVQRGYEQSARWRRYYELLASSYPEALERLKTYLEHGRGIWDLRHW